MSKFKLNKSILPYNTCKNIYRASTLGKRIVEGLVNFAMSVDREIVIQKAPKEVIERFIKTSKSMRQEESIRETLYFSRIYGTGALFVSIFDKESEKPDFHVKPSFEDNHNYLTRFTVLDPLNLSGSRIETDPTSYNFLDIVDFKISGNSIPKKRIQVSHALASLYLDNRTDLLPYAPPSVYYNMINLINEYEDAVKSLGDILYKAGAIIYKYRNSSKTNGVTLDAVSASKKVIELKKSGEVIALEMDSDVLDFPLGNLTGIIDSINKLEDDITKALNDTPASILFDRSLSNGFSEGDKDKETELSIVEAFRAAKLKPLYDFSDYYVMLNAWTPEFIEEIRYMYKGYEDKTDGAIFREWAENFTYEFGNLYPEPKSLIQDIASKKLDNLKKAMELGVVSADIEQELNEMKVFKNEMSIDEQAFDELGDNLYEEDEYQADELHNIKQYYEDVNNTLTDEDKSYIDSFVDDKIIDYKQALEDTIDNIQTSINRMYDDYKTSGKGKDNILKLNDIRNKLKGIYFKMIGIDSNKQKINTTKYNDNCIRLYPSSISKEEDIYSKKKIKELEGRIVRERDTDKRQALKDELNSKRLEKQKLFLENLAYLDKVLSSKLWRIINS